MEHIFTDNGAYVYHILRVLLTEQLWLHNNQQCNGTCNRRLRVAPAQQPAIGVTILGEISESMRTG